MDVLKELNVKYGPAPLWVWGAVITIGAYLYMSHKKSSTASQSTQAAADQTNTDLGSAAEMANLFQVAGLMPYQGGDTYVNVTSPSSGSGSTGTTSGTGTSGSSPYTPHLPSKGPLPVLNGMPPKTTTGSTTASNGSSQYVVKQGDTMVGIAGKHGYPATAAGADALYNYDGNAAVIQAAAKQHGVTKDFVRYIYPGERLNVPTGG